jgi:hypothetical protein
VVEETIFIHTVEPLGMGIVAALALAIPANGAAITARILRELRIARPLSSRISSAEPC